MARSTRWASSASRTRSDSSPAETREKQNCGNSGIGPRGRRSELSPTSDAFRDASTRVATRASSASPSTTRSHSGAPNFFLYSPPCRQRPARTRRITRVSFSVLDIFCWRPSILQFTSGVFWPISWLTRCLCRIQSSSSLPSRSWSLPRAVFLTSTTRWRWSAWREGPLISAVWLAARTTASSCAEHRTRRTTICSA